MKLANLGFTEEDLDKLADPHWRLRNLYYIVDRNANVIPFRPNAAQESLLGNLHYRNVVLKARQRGFSSLIQLMGLDQALFNENYTAGIIAHTLDDASKFLDRIEFAYNSLPGAIRSAVCVVKRNESTIRFSNGSRIDVDTSMRGGTLQFLHVSEFGKICAKYPDKAKEIMTGTLPALAPTGIGFIESTAEGHSGYFFDIVTAAQAKAQLGAKLNRLDFKFHFYSWWDEDEYRLPAESVTLTLDELAYCSEIEAALGTKLEPERWAWYWAQRRILGESMFQEHPSVPDEAFWHSVEGRYYTEQIKAVRLHKRIGDFPHLPDRAVNTVWDIGANDETAIWCWQYAGSRFRLINYHERSGEPFSYFVNWLQSLGYTWGVHYLPHDAEHKRQQGLVVQSAVDMLEDLAPGWRFEIVDRIPDITVGIQQTRNLFPMCEFDEAGTALGFARLEAYRKEWSERHATWKSTPFHGPESNGADAFRALAQLFAAGELRFPAPMRDNIRRPRGNWRTA